MLKQVKLNQNSEKKQQYKPIFELQKSVYTACFCEENIYMLCKEYYKSIQETINNCENVRNEGYALFITTPNQKTLVKFQKLGEGNFDNIVCWDYHVVFVHQVKASKDQKEKSITYVYDFDSILPQPIKFDEYFRLSFGFNKPPPFEKIQFRPVSCDIMLKKFASDRRHMIQKNEEGEISYNSPLPDYPNIVNEKGEEFNLWEFLDIKNTSPEFGMTFQSEEQILELFSHKN